jgi:lysophospholipase L1-like esterase
LKRLLNETHAKIVINTIPDLSLTPAVPTWLKIYSKHMAQKLNKRIVHAENERVIVVDLFNDSRVILESYPEALASDGFHPSDFGYALWANSIISRLPMVFFTPRASF